MRPVNRAQRPEPPVKDAAFAVLYLERSGKLMKMTWVKSEKQSVPQLSIRNIMQGTDASYICNSKFSSNHILKV